MAEKCWISSIVRDGSAIKTESKLEKLFDERRFLFSYKKNNPKQKPFFGESESSYIR